jgi:hypothetical protein
MNLIKALQDLSLIVLLRELFTDRFRPSYILILFQRHYLAIQRTQHCCGQKETYSVAVSVLYRCQHGGNFALQDTVNLHHEKQAARVIGKQMLHKLI